MQLHWTTHSGAVVSISSGGAREAWGTLRREGGYVVETLDLEM